MQSQKTSKLRIKDEILSYTITNLQPWKCPESTGVGREQGVEKKNRDYILKPKNLYNAQVALGSQARQNGEERVQLPILDNAILRDY